MRESKKNNKGFSLVEMLVAITILVAVVAPLTKILISSSKVNQKTQRVMSATEMAQNIFEGIDSKRPEDAIVELSALALSDSVTLDKPLSVVPNGMTYEKIGEYTSVVDPATGVSNLVPGVSIGGQFVQSKVADSSTGKTRCKGFAEASSGVYGFWIQGLQQSNTYYDIKICFDSSQYNTTYAPNPSDPLQATDYVTIPIISNVNGAYDGMFMEGSLALYNVLSGEYRGNQIGSPMDEAEILKNMKRTYTLDIKDIGVSGAPQIVADMTQHYEYKNAADLAIGSTGEYTSSLERIFDSSAYNSVPRNLFIYYTPNYNSTLKGDGALDQFVINNMCDYDVNVYIVRMEQTGTEASTLNNESAHPSNEDNYTATVSIFESDNTVVNTTLRTNLNENILKAGTMTEYKDRERTGNKITYKVDGLLPTEVENALTIKSLDAQDEEKRVYDVTIDVYMGKSVGQGNDNNGNYSYTGAYANNFPDAAKLATFKGKVVQ